MQGMSASEIKASVVAAAGFSSSEEMTQAAVNRVASGDTWLNRIVETARTVIPKAVASASAAMAQLSFAGSTGNFLSGEDTIVLTAKCLKMVNQAPEKVGSPLMSYEYISTLSGYVQCKNAAFQSTTATVEEEIAIEEFMNNGFFYE